MRVWGFGSRVSLIRGEIEGLRGHFGSLGCLTSGA